MMTWMGAIVGGIAGGYIPVLFGAETLSLASLVGNTVGGVIGVFIGYRIALRYGM